MIWPPKMITIRHLLRLVFQLNRGGCWEQNKQVLTPRELEVLSAIVCHGMSNKDIGRFFDIAEDAVKKHMTSMYDKTGVSTRIELDHFAREHKLPVKELF